MAYRRPLPNLQSASRGNRQELLATLLQYANRLNDLEKRASGGTFSGKAPGLLIRPPKAAQFAASGSGAMLSVHVTNPEYVLARAPGKFRGNPVKAPILHKISYSNDPRFKSGVTTIDPTTQTVFTLPWNGRKVYVKLQSSHDGVKFNTARVQST